MSEEKKELLAKINGEIATAMKAKDEFGLSVLRMIKSKILYVNARGDMPDADIIKIITKYAKELKESIEEFKKVGRQADSDKVTKELAFVQEYLPKELSADEIKALVQSTIAELGASSIKEMGNVMKAISAKAPGVDGKIVSQFVREVLK